MSDSTNRELRNIARASEEFPGLLAALKPTLAGLVPDDKNYSGDSYDELFVILAAALYLAHDQPLRKRNADKAGGNPKLVSVLLDEGAHDKDAILVEKVLGRLAAYVHPRDFIDSLAAMYGSSEQRFLDYRVAFERIMSDLWHIASGGEPHPKCPAALAAWASGPHLPSIYAILFPPA